MKAEYLADPRISFREICRRHKAHPASLGKRLRKEGFEFRPSKNAYNHTFFSQIDTEAKAYFLGLMYADGNVIIGKRGDHVARIRLVRDDEAILRTMRDLASPGQPLRYSFPNRGRETAGLTMNSKQMVHDLIRLGCVPNKSLILRFPTHEIVPQHLFHHFIRGYFDGDGCISFYQLKPTYFPCATIAFESSPDFCTVMKEWLRQTLNIGCSLIRNGQSNSRGIHVIGNLQICRLIDFMYKDATISLERKRRRCERFVKAYRSKPKQRSGVLPPSLSDLKGA